MRVWKVRAHSAVCLQRAVTIFLRCQWTVKSNQRRSALHTHARARAHKHAHKHAGTHRTQHKLQRHWTLALTSVDLLSFCPLLIKRGQKLQGDVSLPPVSKSLCHSLTSLQHFAWHFNPLSLPLSVSLAPSLWTRPLPALCHWLSADVSRSLWLVDSDSC